MGDVRKSWFQVFDQWEGAYTVGEKSLVVTPVSLPPYSEEYCLYHSYHAKLVMTSDDNNQKQKDIRTAINDELSIAL